VDAPTPWSTDDNAWSFTSTPPYDFMKCCLSILPLLVFNIAVEETGMTIEKDRKRNTRTLIILMTYYGRTKTKEWGVKSANDTNV
jgi:hypothetical protein